MFHLFTYYFALFARVARFGRFVSGVSFRWFRFVVSGFSTCRILSHCSGKQLFQQRLARNSVKAHAKMSIGIMGSKSLALLDWGSRWFSNKERKRRNTRVWAFPSTTLKHLSGSIKQPWNHNYPYWLSTWSRKLFPVCKTTFLEIAVY